MKVTKWSYMLLLFLITFTFAASSYGESVVVPNGLTNLAGNATADAFDCDRPQGVRFQQVILGSEVGNGTIISSAVRAIPDTIAFGPEVFPNVIFKMSTTDREPGELSSVFADNIGPDERTVFQGSFTSSAPSCVGLSPCPFAQPIVFQNPFPFNPLNGNLLIEIIVPPCAPIDGLPESDATSDFNNVIEFVFADNSNSPEGEVIPGGGIFEFKFAATRNIPTLSQWGLFAMAGVLGLAGFLVIRRKKAAA